VFVALTGEAVSAQTVSRLAHGLDQTVREFQSAAQKNEWAYLFLDGVALKVLRLAGRSMPRCWWP
jgi:transposase-like protein